MARQQRQYQLTMFLLRGDFRQYKDALKDIKSLETYDLAEGVSFEGLLFVQPRSSKSAWWRSFVQAGIDGNLPDQLNSGTSAVLFVECGDRTVVYTFGYGRYLLNEEAYERDFGLKTALGLIDPTTLRSIDVKTVEDVTLHRRAQASRGTDLPTFGLDVSRDLMSAATGEPPEGSPISRVTGKDSLSLSVRVVFPDLGDLADDVLAVFDAKAYAERYPWVDHLREVRSPSQKSDLDELLIEDLRAQRLDLIHMAPPEVIDTEFVEGYVVTGTGSREVRPYLSVHEYCAALPDLSSPDIDKLKRDRVYVKFANAAAPLSKWSVYACIVAELQHQDRTYVLSGGDYYEADSDFVEGVDGHLRTLEVTSLPFPDHRYKEPEDVYNDRAANALSGALLHGNQNQIRIRAGEYPIEPCDIFTGDQQFAHVKRSSESSCLSHLFAQGLISGEALFDHRFREELRDRLAKCAPAFVELIPLDEALDPNDLTVLYAIIARESEDWPCSLPFFSRVNLSSTATRLTRFGYGVATQCIQRDKEPSPEPGDE